MKGDPILEGMARELKAALLAAGLDPSKRPSVKDPPNEQVWEEYKNRGGEVYDDPQLLAEALIRRVEEISR